MKKLAKAILISLAVIALLIIIAGVAVSSYLQSPSARERLEAELSRVLNTPVRVTSTSVSPWGGVRFNGVSIPGEGGVSFEAASFSAGYRLLPLLRKEVVISNVTLERPQLVWSQNEEGKFVWPKEAREEEPERAKEVKRDRPKRDGMRVTLDGFRINGGSIELLDKNRNQLALLTDIDIAYEEKQPERYAGSGTIGRLIWWDTMVFENVRSPFTYENGELNVTELQAEAGGGALQGAVQAQLDAEDSPFTASLKWEQVDAAGLRPESKSGPANITGTLSGNLEVRGVSGDMEQLQGSGRITLANGRLRQMEFFETLGEVFGISQLADLRVRQGRAEFRLAEGKTLVDNLVLEAGDLQLAAKGEAGFDQRLALDAQLAVSERIRLPSFLTQNFVATATPGQQAIDFKIGGSFESPTTDLAGRLIGRDLGEQIQDLVTSIFGRKKKDDSKEEKKEKKKKKDKDKDKDKKAPAPEAEADGEPAAADSAGSQ